MISSRLSYYPDNVSISAENESLEATGPGRVKEQPRGGKSILVHHRQKKISPQNVRIPCGQT